MLHATSLSRRLLLAASVFIGAALIIAGVVLFFVLHRFVQGQIDQRLDTQIAFLSSMLRSQNGTLTLAGNADGPPFDGHPRGWYWEAIGPNNTLRSRALGNRDLDISKIAIRPPPPPPPPPPAGEDRPPPPGSRPAPGDDIGPDQQWLLFRILRTTVSGMPLTIVATAPRAAVLGPLREAMTTLAISLFALAIALVLAMIFQVRLGLQPLERLRRSIAEVRAGRSDRIAEVQPREVQPLVSELNSLLEQNALNLDRARRHVANLAHGLKTPLATLAVALPKDERGTEMHGLVELMERHIRHHLGRARAAALNGPTRARTVLGPHITDLGAVLGKVHDKHVDFNVDIAGDLAVACEEQDFDEMAGNLLDNAFQWTRKKVDVYAGVKDANSVVLSIEDDGPGLDLEQVPQVLQPGQRLDEHAPGFGFGLSITRELAELYGGSLEFQKSPAGGVRVVVTLPKALNGAE
ncbi:MAG: HAMP domain-containing sensor histidine kinase [Xanthobacteraceae bacterium]|nr:HAMP domain-containing sensor histidine kinase [Xanthobacteraceae bacterium]